jgi:hypothetical protein
MVARPRKRKSLHQQKADVAVSSVAGVAVEPAVAVTAQVVMARPNQVQAVAALCLNEWRACRAVVDLMNQKMKMMIRTVVPRSAFHVF